MKIVIRITQEEAIRMHFQHNEIYNIRKMLLDQANKIEENGNVFNSQVSVEIV